jgi:PPP family 3-phenylpropionic acid transporter
LVLLPRLQHDRSQGAINPMPSNPQELTGEPAGEPASAFARRLALFYASIFVVLGVILPFLPVWLAAKGLDPQTIGVVLALPIVLRLFAIPMATRAADRHDALRTVTVVTAALALLGFVALGLATGTPAIAAIYALAATAYMPLFVLSDVYALRGLTNYRQAYGPVRLWGSAAFIVATLGAGSLLGVVTAGDLIWLIVAAMAFCAATAWALPPLAARSSTAAGAPVSARTLLRDPAFISVAVAASLIQGSHALYYGFATIDWQAAGFGGGSIGLLWSLGVLAEIVLFALSARLPAALSPGVLIVIGAAGALIRWSAMALGLPAALLPVLQCLHALSFGATHIGTLAVIARVAPSGLAATAQGYFSVVQGLMMAGATGLSGLLYGRFGAGAYGAMAVMAGAGLVAALVAHRLQSAERRGVDR